MVFLLVVGLEWPDCRKGVKRENGGKRLKKRKLKEQVERKCEDVRCRRREDGVGEIQGKRQTNPQREIAEFEFDSHLNVQFLSQIGRASGRERV